MGAPAKQTCDVPALPARGRVHKKVVHLPVWRYGEAGPQPDAIAIEEPLEIRLAGETVAVIMRTPGEDHRLALGYLFGEGVLSSAEDATTVFHCGRPGQEGYGNVIDVMPASGARIDWDKLDGVRRATVTTSACGVCGRTAIDDLLAGITPVQESLRVHGAQVSAAVEGLRSHQPAFDATGGTHCAALYAADGKLIASAEDVGRHNAVDKVVGSVLLERANGREVSPAILAVSGRAGFDIIQKVARAGIPIVASVSAPTSLAVSLAEAAGVTLCGFVRGRRINVYTRSERILG